MSYSSNFRPITLTNNVSKILEKCIKIRLIESLNYQNIFSKYQLGFINDMSTNDAPYFSTGFIYDKLYIYIYI